MIIYSLEQTLKTGAMLKTVNAEILHYEQE